MMAKAASKCFSCVAVSCVCVGGNIVAMLLVAEWC